ncbi:hypothetical protein WA158_006896 [Blastocystis sp. Blastoise]
MSKELIEDKYLFTFQDEKQLWIPREFIKKYHQLPFYDIIQHTEKYEDGSYYIDMPSLSMDKVIHFLMDDNIDISSLNLKDSYDIYETILEYSVKIDKGIQCDLLIHIKQLFYSYLNGNNYDIDGCYCSYIESRMPMDLFNLEEKKIFINDDYASNVPLEYICPSCIKDIFPSLEEITIFVTTHYKVTNQLLNPNSDEYIIEYIHLFSENDYKIENPEEYKYYTKSEMKKYNKTSSLDLNKKYYSHKLIDIYNEKREKNELPKLYKYIIDEPMYTSDYSNVKTSYTEDGYVLYDQVTIKYENKTNDKTFTINEVSTEHGISQLLLLPTYLIIFNIILKAGYINNCPGIILKLFEEGIFDSLTTLNVSTFQQLTNIFDDNLLNKIMTTYVFPNVTEFIYDNGCFQSSLITKECFPKLHIINYDIFITNNNFESLFHDNLISMIDTIRIQGIGYQIDEEVCRLDNLVYTHSLHIDIIFKYINNWIYLFPHLNELLTKDLISFDKLSIDSSRSENIKVLEYIENYNQNIDCLEIRFEELLFNENRDKIDIRNALERFLKSDLLKHLECLTIIFDVSFKINMEYLTWISTLFNDNKFNTIHKLEIDYDYGIGCIDINPSSEYLTAYENIFEKFIPKASIVNINNCTMTLINRLITKGCFLNTTQLTLNNIDTPDDNFYKIYTTDNFPQLKYIKFCIKKPMEKWISLCGRIYDFFYNDNTPLSRGVRLSNLINYLNADNIYNPNNSIFRYKYDSNSFIDTIIGTYDEATSKSEIETLIDYINKKKTQNIRFLRLYIYDEKQLSKLINFIITGKIPQLKELIIVCTCDNSLYGKADIYKHQLRKSSFIQENHVNYLLI